METVKLEVAKRENKGSRSSRVSRRAGRIPAVVYGHGMEPLSIEVEMQKLNQALHTKAGDNVVVDLDLSGATMKESTCLIKDIQHHPVTDVIQHVDFTVISMKEKIHVEVPVETANSEDAPGVRAGGILDVVHHTITVECLPTAIPEALIIDISDMEIDSLKHVSDLQLPEGVACLLAPEETLISIHPPRVEEEKAEGEEEGEEGAAEPEVIEKGKKEEGEGAEAPAES